MPTAAKKQSITPAQTTNANVIMPNESKVEKEKFSVFLEKPQIKESIKRVLNSEEAMNKFSKELLMAVSSVSDLSKCTYPSIVSAALIGATLNLSSNTAIGQYYLVPYSGKAQFQLSWKGYYQLAMRSNMYKTIDVSVVKEGEIEYYNPITKEIRFKPILDDSKREKLPTVGYFAWFELKNGFRKEEYWSKEKMEQHAKRYSKAYNSAKGISYWKTDFDSMALKTMYRQLISKYGPMSTEMEKAYTEDMTTGEEIDGEDREYIDNPPINAETGEIEEG